MATLIIPGATQVSLHFTVSGQELVNVLGFTAPEPQAVDTIAKRVAEAWNQTGGPHKLIPAAVVLDKVKAVDLSSATGAVYEHVVNAPGGSGGVLGSLATTAVVRIGASSRSRSGKGRVYFGPLATTYLSADGRTISAGNITNINNAFNLFKTTMDANTMTWAVLSRKLLAATPVTSISTASVIGTQRRRLR